MRKAIFCKSFRGDFHVLKNLVSSVARFAPDMRLLISVPKADLALLQNTQDIPGFVTVVTDEEYLGRDGVSKMGWYQQQVCKLSMHRLDFADSYLILDSDTYLISEVSDKIFHEGDKLIIVANEIFTKFRPSNSILLACMKGQRQWTDIRHRMGSLNHFEDRIASALSEHKSNQHLSGRDREKYIRYVFDSGKCAVQPSQIFHAAILKSMERRLAAIGVSWNRLINLAPWEYNWYAHYALASPEFEIVGKASPVVHFASEQDVMYAKDHGVSVELLQEHFCAVAMASRHFERTEF